MKKVKGKPVFLVYLTLAVHLTLSCNSGTQTVSAENTTQKDSIIQEEGPVSTALPVVVTSQLPVSFYIDTISYNDSFENPNDSAYLSETEYELSGYFPQSDLPKYKKFNDALRKMIDDFLLQYKKIAKKEFGSVSASIWLSDMKLEKDFVSLEFMEQSYWYGAAHYNHRYVTFNYDLLESREIKMKDFLLFKNDDEKQKFCDAFNPDKSIASFEDVILNADDFSDERSFTAEYFGIRLFFDVYEKGTSRTSIHIPHSKFRSFVNKKYIKLFEQ